MTETQPQEPTGPTPRKRTPRHATVTAVRQVTPHVVRVTIAGPELAAIEPTGHTDTYVKLVLGELADGRPLLRAYTVRAQREAADSASGEAEWDLDLVVHGDEGVGGPWATRARPGDPVTFLGPGSGYAPDPSAPWHLLVGDDAALPAIAAAVEALPAGAVAHVVVEVPGPQDEQDMDSAADVTVTWVHRGAGDLAATVRAARATFPAGAPHVFLHGEAGMVRDLRRWVRTELDVPRELLSASGYWRRGSDDEDWRARKGEWKAAVEQDDAALVG